MRGPMTAAMPSSSSSSRLSACSGVSPGSIFPPGNSHLRLIGCAGLRWETRTSVPPPFSVEAWRRMRATTTSRTGLPLALPLPSSLRIGSFTRALFLRCRLPRVQCSRLLKLRRAGADFALRLGVAGIGWAFCARGDTHAVQLGPGLGGLGRVGKALDERTQFGYAGVALLEREQR